MIKGVVRLILGGNMITYRIHLIRHGMAEDPEKKMGDMDTCIVCVFVGFTYFCFTGIIAQNNW